MSMSERDLFLKFASLVRLPPRTSVAVEARLDARHFSTALPLSDLGEISPSMPMQSGERMPFMSPTNYAVWSEGLARMDHSARFGGIVFRPPAARMPPRVDVKIYHQPYDFYEFYIVSDKFVVATEYNRALAQTLSDLARAASVGFENANAYVDIIQDFDISQGDVERWLSRRVDDPFIEDIFTVSLRDVGTTWHDIINNDSTFMKISEITTPYNTGEIYAAYFRPVGSTTPPILAAYVTMDIDHHLNFIIPEDYVDIVLSAPSTLLLADILSFLAALDAMVRNRVGETAVSEPDMLVPGASTFAPRLRDLIQSIPHTTTIPDVSGAVCGRAKILSFTPTTLSVMVNLNNVEVRTLRLSDGTIVMAEPPMKLKGSLTLKWARSGPGPYQPAGKRANTGIYVTTVTGREFYHDNTDDDGDVCLGDYSPPPINLAGSNVCEKLREIADTVATILATPNAASAYRNNGVAKIVSHEIEIPGEFNGHRLTPSRIAW